MILVAHARLYSTLVRDQAYCEHRQGDVSVEGELELDVYAPEWNCQAIATVAIRYSYDSPLYSTST